MVKIRLQRFGRRNRPSYRVVVTDVRTKRQGASLENVGTYDPIQKDAAKELNLLVERIDAWVAKGAQMSDAVRNLVKQARKKAPAAAAAKA